MDMFAIDREKAVVALKELLERGKEFKDFSVFETEEIKVLANDWYNALIDALNEHISSPEKLIKKMNKVLEKNPKVIFSPALRRNFITSYIGEMESKQYYLKEKIENILKILGDLINDL